MKHLLLLALLVSGCAAPTIPVVDAGPVDRSPAAQFLPTATGPCPMFSPGRNTFKPKGQTRDVLIWVSDQAQTLDGPLVFFWHGAGGDPSEAPYVLGPAMQAVVDMGGIVAAPFHDPNAGSLPWYLSGGGSDDTDLRIADEVLACARQTVGVDVRRIHSVGFSAGAMHNTQFVAFRSGYLASIVNYSGARLSEPDEQDPTNKYPAMLFYGGPSDQVVISFDTETHAYEDALKASGHFTFLCNHDMGHTVPDSGVAAAWQFLLDHPFGAQPEPYLASLPSSFPDYCSL